jgi:hypothetical protein
MKRLAVACLLLFSGCNSSDVVRETLAPVGVSPSPGSASALPSGVVDPQSLIDQATHLRSIVLRVDDVTAKLVTISDFMKDSGTTNPNASPRQPIWVVAIRGDVRIDSIVDLPHAQCAVFAYDAITGYVQASRAGASAICDPYFK